MDREQRERLEYESYQYRQRKAHEDWEQDMRKKRRKTVDKFIDNVFLGVALFFGFILLKIILGF